MTRFLFVWVMLAWFLSGCLSGNLPPVLGSPKEKALAYLLSSQVKTGPWAGSWEQRCFWQGTPPVGVSDQSPFVMAFIHHSLSLCTQKDLPQAVAFAGHHPVSQARRRTLAYLKLFATPSYAGDPAGYGFWTHVHKPQQSCFGGMDCMLGMVFQGPKMNGPRTPWFWIYSPDFGLPADADDTVVCWWAFDKGHQMGECDLPGGDPVALLRRHRFDGGALQNPLPFFKDHKGAFATWLVSKGLPNDVDPVVNAQVLWFLAQRQQTQVPGYQEAVRLVQEATPRWMAQGDGCQLSQYYQKSLAWAYVVCRACKEGPVPELAPTVKALERWLLAQAEEQEGHASWWQGSPFNTALAVNALALSGYLGRLLKKGVRFLAASQREDGSFKGEVFFQGRTHGGQTFVWKSKALSTALALEAMIRVQKLHP